MRDEKQLLLDEIKENIDKSNALVFTRYQSLKPNLSADFRMNLTKVGGAYTVVRKRVLLKAAEAEGLDLKEENLQGHIGVAFAYEDPINMTKALFDFVKDNAGTMEVIGGQFEGKLYSAEDVKAISKLPSQDEMRAQLLGLFEAPMAQTVSVMENLLTSIMHCLENKAQASQE